ncbi:MAG: DUF3096 domain-containing protein [Halofilum sp. (in: g-proteobacteria)]|nr:DUF3096 domain-containing protein [Halofilum sp. (in: g-proteobacteria)]
MTLHLELIPILSIAAGIALLVAPQRALRPIVAGYLIIVGVIGIIQ